MNMKKLSLFLFLLAFVSANVLLAQPFSYVRISPPIVYGNTTDSSNLTSAVASYSVVTNTSSSPLTIIFFQRNQSYPNGWSVQMCSGIYCYSGDSSIYEHLPPNGKDTISVHFYYDTINGSGHVSIVVKDSLSGDTISQQFGAEINPVGIRQIGTIVKGFALGQNYPNPFNPTTNIHFSLPKDGDVSLKIYDILGNEVATVVSGNVKAGTYNAEVDASNWASGVYFYKLTAGNFVETKKMSLIK